MSEFREKLAAVIAQVVPSLADYALFYEPGCTPPTSNHLNVVKTYAKFCAEFLPQCPIVDPFGRKIKIRKNMFPKFLAMEVRPGFFHKKASRIVELLESGQFNEAEFEVAEDRRMALFWVPDVIRDPDAIFKVKQTDHLVKADEVYVKVFEKPASNVKLVFVQRVGKYGDTVFVTSYLTPPHTAIKYCDGQPIYVRRK